MAFLAITLAIIAACIFAVRRLAQQLDVTLDRRALLLCAFMAMLVNFASLKISSSLTAGHYCLIAALVLASAALVTYLQERVLFRAVPADGAPDENYDETAENDLVERAETLEPAAEPQAPPFFGPGLARADETTEASTLSEFPVEQTNEPFAFATASETDEVKAAEPPEETKETKETKFLGEQLPDDNLLDEVSSRFEAELEARRPAAANTLAVAAADPFVGSVEIAEDDFVPAAAEPIIYPEADTEVEREADTEVIDLTEPETETTVEVETETETETETEAEYEVEPRPKLAADTGKIDSFTTLDEYLDYIFEQKQLNNQINTIYACNQALDKFADDDYAPFIVIDIANIYKTNGAYDAAINLYQQALSLKAVRGSKGMSDEFRKSLAYLEAVKYILSQHDAPEMPFKNIPAELFSEIEQEFSLRQKQIVH